MPRQCTPIEGVSLADQARFWKKVLKSEDHDGCWEWTAYRDARGYGWFRLGGGSGRMYVAHRVSFAIENGATAGDKWFVCHRCDNPSCVRPDHLFLGTNRQNSDDCIQKGRHHFQNGRTWKGGPKENRARGERVNTSKLTAEKVRAIRARVGKEPDAAIAPDFGVTPGAIWAIRTGRVWKHVQDE